jgi:hypothetical protein
MTHFVYLTVDLIKIIVVHTQCAWLSIFKSNIEFYLKWKPPIKDIHKVNVVAVIVILWLRSWSVWSSV